MACDFFGAVRVPPVARVTATGRNRHIASRTKPGRRVPVHRQAGEEGEQADAIPGGDDIGLGGKGEEQEAGHRLRISRRQGRGLDGPGGMTHDRSRGLE